MVRRLVLVLSLAALIGSVGCKDDSNTSMKFDPKANYKTQQQPPGHGTGAGTGATTETKTP